jgi:hypothetical protein
LALLKVLREIGHIANSRLQFANFALTLCNYEAARFTHSFLQLHLFNPALL